MAKSTITAAAVKKPEEEEQTSGFTYTLEKPIEAHGEEVKTLKFREPTARDMMDCGNPVNFDPISDPPKITFDNRSMALMMSRLSGVPTSSIGQLQTRDFTGICWNLAPFFVPVPGTI
jgi:Phage tail assembly chaperone proteins, E, or 41 or 14